MLLRYVIYYLGRGCMEGKCWCISNGERTCQRWEYSYNSIYETQCDNDKCDVRSGCNKNGYWCDDNAMSNSKGWFQKCYIMNCNNNNVICPTSFISNHFTTFSYVPNLQILYMLIAPNTMELTAYSQLRVHGGIM